MIVMKSEVGKTNEKAFCTKLFGPKSQQRDDILLAKIKTTLKTLNVGKNGPSNS